MKTTTNLIQGEVYAIMQKFHIPFCKMYSSEFYDSKFVIAVANTLKDKLPEYKVTLTKHQTSSPHDYVLEINWAVE